MSIGPILSLCAAVWANGGPEAWTKVTPLGSAAPRETTDVRLVSEDLHIALQDDLLHYSVRAVYHLQVPHVAHLRFAVPLTWMLSGDEPTSVGVRVNGEPFACQQEAASSAVGNLDMMPVPAPIQGWCTGWLDLFAGDDVPLTLEYVGELLYTDWTTSKSPLTYFGDRTLYYPLFPAAAWSGTPDRVEIVVDLGRWRSFLGAWSPADGVGGERSLNWVWSNPDLAEKDALRVPLQVGVVLRARQVQHWNQAAPEPLRLGLTASASSSLSAQGAHSYLPANLVDGDPATAWCEGVEGVGVGQWVEVTMRAQPVEEPVYGAPSLDRISMVPGYGRSEESWAGNGRVKAVRVSPCGDASGGRVVDLSPLSSVPWTAASLVMEAWGEEGERTMPELGDPAESPICLRFTIQEVEPGTRWQDTCISEIVPILNWF